MGMVRRIHGRNPMTTQTEGSEEQGSPNFPFNFSCRN